MKKILPWIVVLAMAAWVVSGLRQKPETGFHTRAFGKLPVVMNGRVKPFDTVARNSLLQIRTKQSVVWKEDGKARTMSADEWLVEVMMKPEQADDRKIFRIDNLELLSLLKLPEDQKYYTFNQLKPQSDELSRQAERVDKIESANRTAFESQLMKLYNAVNLYQRLQISLKPPGTDDYAAELVALQKVIGPGMAAVRAQQAGEKYDQTAFDRIVSFIGGYDTVARFALPLVIPPSSDETSGVGWQNIGTSIMEMLRGQELKPAVRSYAEMVTAYRHGDVADFNRAVAEYDLSLQTRFAGDVRKAGQEDFFNAFEPFYKATVIYVLAFVLACLFWFNLSEWMRLTSFWLVVLAGILHTFGLIFRMYLEGRPPVTNLYSSAVFIGWGAVILGLVLERIYRDGIGLVTASFVGFITQVIAHNLAASGDTMEMMRAVLDTNFWLATHVVTVTLGYASTFVAGFLAIIYVMRGVFTKTLSSETAKALTRMVYGIICFATLFSFVGTVLGGIWADQSWGRFWGWDPKENGALLIVIWNALILHARWGGIVKERGLMNLAIFGNIITAFSWFGVNMLGIGLHSYGFMDAAFKWLMFFDASQVALIVLGLLPLSMWRSFQTSASSAEPPTKPGHRGRTSPSPAGA
jgi:ABC-type transport system involved in cytochrome c biogenesis permease subunit